MYFLDNDSLTFDAKKNNIKSHYMAYVNSFGQALGLAGLSSSDFKLGHNPSVLRDPYN